MGNALRFLCCGKPSADSESLGTRGLSATTVGVSGHAHDLSNFQITSRELIGDLGPVSLPEGIKFELQTLPVYAKAVGDGDGMTVYVSTADPRESSYVPSDVQKAAKERSKALDVGNKRVARKRQDQIVKAGYRVINFQNEEILARKYRIRLRGIDAPECEMPYGPEAKEELTKIVRGKCLRILVYGEDRYGRLVGDVYCNDIFVQKVMLTNGMAWHYANYDKRPELAKWEKAARAKRIGLWADPNPRKPWEWRKERRGGR